MKAAELVGKKTVIVGEAGAGKTKLLAEFLREFLRLFGRCKITVIDLAPEKIAGIGGPLNIHLDLSGFHYLRPGLVYAPRLMACNAEDVLRYAKHNAEQARKLFEIYLQGPTEVLAVNDLTIYLHAGEVEEIIDIARRANTFVATAYQGERLSEDFGTGISMRERQKLEKFLEHVDNVIRLNSEKTQQIP